MNALLERLSYISIPLLVAFLISSSPAFPEDPEDELPPVVDTIEKLYRDYKEIDEKMRELRQDLEGQTPSSLLTPLTITIKKDRGFTLISVELAMDDRYLLSHLYSTTENMAMEQGGRHLLYNGALEKGIHRISVTYSYRVSHDPKEHSTGWTIELQDEPFILEIFFKKADKDSIKVVPARVYLVDEKGHQDKQ